ncbi:MAG: DUF2177 family protein [Anaerolineales bacterium]|nr:DUF2177 family protein [Anaerolineales bacterium]
MAYFVQLYLVILAAFLAIDLVWLGLVARRFYRKQLGFIMAAKTNLLAAISFYVLFNLGVLFFVVSPGLESGSLEITLLRAALFGLITYATYDLTNLATLKAWPLIVTLVDILWGVVLVVLISLLGFLAGQWLV